MTSGEPIDDTSHRQSAAASPPTLTYFTYHPWLLALLLSIITFAVYQPTWRAGFLWDDNRLITDNPTIQAHDGLYRIWFTTETLDYYPLTSSFWWLEWRLWGKNPTGYHVVNVLLHIVNVLLMWVILCRLRVPGAWLAALVYAIHPVNVATVAWISEQKNTLSMLFYAMAILFYLRFDEENRWRWYALSLATFLLALFSKSAVVMLPVVLLGCVWWKRGQVRWKDLLRSIPFFAFSLVLGLTTIWFQHNRAMEGGSARSVSFLFRLAAAGWVPWFYLSKAILPTNLSVFYPNWEIDPSLWVTYLPGILLVGCVMLFWWTRQTWGRPLLFAWGYFVTMLFPVLGFFDQGFYTYSLVADHWQYYSVIGIIALMVATGVTQCRKTGSWPRHIGTVAGAVVLAALGTSTWMRAGVYAHAETLWRDTLAKNPDAWVARNNLGIALKDRGQIQEAIGQYEQALRINPQYADAHYNLGAVLLQTGKIKDAIAHYEQVLRIRPDDAEAHNNLGMALVQSGEIKEAMQHYEEALRINPQYADAHYNLGAVLLQTGKTEEAITHYEQALRITPEDAEAQNNLGAALVQTAKGKQAIAHFEQALRIKPDYAEAHFNLAVALENTGSTREALDHYRQALKLRSDFAAASNAVVRLQAH